MRYRARSGERQPKGPITGRLAESKNDRLLTRTPHTLDVPDISGGEPLCASQDLEERCVDSAYGRQKRPFERIFEVITDDFLSRHPLYSPST
jgi:hypothetical protein